VTHSVTHSGVTWLCLGYGKQRRPIWPIEEYLIRTNHTPEEEERIRRLNPNGKEEGEAPIL
jgi:hypothetical protein